VRAHLQRTVGNYLQLRELAPELPIIPVIQGAEVADYRRCVDFYERHGVDLAALPLVGVGSVRRRSHTGEVERIVWSLHARGLAMHCFGVKTLGLARYGEAIASSDSAVWSFSGPRVAGHAVLSAARRREGGNGERTSARRRHRRSRGRRRRVFRGNRGPGDRVVVHWAAGPGSRGGLGTG
jgi:hypothetical protein